MILTEFLHDGTLIKHYSDKNVMPYIDNDGSIVAPIGYGEKYFNAQTGELMERYEVNRYEESLRMPKKILTWDDVN